MDFRIGYEVLEFTDGDSYEIYVVLTEGGCQCCNGAVGNGDQVYINWRGMLICQDCQDDVPDDGSTDSTFERCTAVNVNTQPRRGGSYWFDRVVRDVIDGLRFVAAAA